MKTVFRIFFSKSAPILQIPALSDPIIMYTMILDWHLQCVPASGSDYSDIWFREGPLGSAGEVEDDVPQSPSW